MKMFSTIQRPSRSFTWITLSLLPSPMSTNGSSSAPIWTAVGAESINAMLTSLNPAYGAPHASSRLCRCRPRAHAHPRARGVFEQLETCERHDGRRAAVDHDHDGRSTCEL